jgi:hypothetical protein
MGNTVIDQLRRQSKTLPQIRVPLMSKLTFWWINDIIMLGYNRDLKREDMWLMEESETSKYNIQRLEFEWKKETDKYYQNKLKAHETKKDYHHLKYGSIQEVSLETDLNKKRSLQISKQKPSFGRTLIKVYKGKFLAGSLLRLINDLLNFAGPLILNKLIDFIRDKKTEYHCWYILCKFALYNFICSVVCVAACST